MNIVYCRECTPKRAVAAGTCTIPAEHTTGDPLVTHTDCGVVAVAEDPKTDEESSDAYLARMDATHGAQYV